MKVSKTDRPNQFKTGFPKLITGLPKKADINIPNLKAARRCTGHFELMMSLRQTVLGCLSNSPG